MKYKRRMLFLLFIFFGPFFYSSPILGQRMGQVEALSQKTGRSCIFTVEIAETKDERSRGLMFREALDPHAGMLFIFPDQDLRIFWMKNTKIPLDLIFMDDNKRIVHIHHNATPMSEANISSRVPARYVLEVNAGMANKCGLARGDKVKINLSVP